MLDHTPIPKCLEGSNFSWLLLVSIWIEPRGGIRMTHTQLFTINLQIQARIFKPRFNVYLFLCTRRRLKNSRRLKPLSPGLKSHSIPLSHTTCLPEKRLKTDYVAQIFNWCWVYFSCSEESQDTCVQKNMVLSDSNVNATKLP